MLIASTATFLVRRRLEVRRRAADISAASWTVVVYDQWHNTVAALTPSAVTVSPAWRRRGVTGLMNAGGLWWDGVSLGPARLATWLCRVLHGSRIHAQRV